MDDYGPSPAPQGDRVSLRRCSQVRYGIVVRKDRAPSIRHGGNDFHCTVVSVVDGAAIGSGSIKPGFLFLGRCSQTLARRVKCGTVRCGTARRCCRATECDDGTAVWVALCQKTKATAVNRPVDSPIILAKLAAFCFFVPLQQQLQILSQIFSMPLIDGFKKKAQNWQDA